MDIKDSHLSSSSENTTDVNLVEVKGLKVYFPINRGFLQRRAGYIKAVDGVSFNIPRGSTVGLVGESGSGKTTTGHAIVKLAPITAGTIHYTGDDITHLTRRAFFPYRKKIQIVFQDPYNSLNPRMTVSQIIQEPLDIHFTDSSREQKRDRIVALLEKVGLEPDHLKRYPHEFSGGQRQRIGIARALAVEPELLICDEPVSALDVSVQAQIINLLQDLQEEFGLAYLFIAHDLAVIEQISDWVLVMNEGKIVEQALAETLYRSPQHPYTQKLLEAIPVL